MYNTFSQNSFSTRRVNLLLIGVLLLLLSFRTDKGKAALGAEPKGLPEIDTAITHLTWTKIVTSHHSALEYKPYRPYDTAMEVRRELYVAAFGSVNAWWEEPWPVTDSSKHNFRNKAVYEQFAGQFYKSKKLRNLIYEWIKPYYVDTYKKMPEWKKKMYRELLFETKNYVHHFNYDAALNNYNRRGLPIDPTYKTTSSGASYRMESWVFRRVHNKQLTRKEIEYWADRMIKDLREVERGEN